MRRFIPSNRLFTASPAVWSIGYSCLAIALWTLNPYDFQAYSSAEWWVWRFRISDVCQNIVLFLSLGILLRYRLRFSYRLCLLSGFLLSLSIEVAQLFLASRTSNYVDLLANSTGALFGALAYNSCSKLWNQETVNLDLALMLIPVCWARSFLSLILPNWIGLLGLNAIAAFSLLASGSLRIRQSLVLLCLWSLVAFAPMSQYFWKQGIAISLLAWAATWLGNHLSMSLKRRCIIVLSLDFGLSSVFSAMWILSNRDSLITFWPNLPVIEVLLLGTTLLYAWTTMKQGDRSAQLEPR